MSEIQDAVNDGNGKYGNDQPGITQVFDFPFRSKWPFKDADIVIGTGPEAFQTKPAIGILIQFGHVEAIRTGPAICAAIQAIMSPAFVAYFLGSVP
jgi:hypothetical protein